MASVSVMIVWLFSTMAPLPSVDQSPVRAIASSAGSIVGVVDHNATPVVQRPLRDELPADPAVTTASASVCDEEDSVEDDACLESGLWIFRLLYWPEHNVLGLSLSPHGLSRSSSHHLPLRC